MFEKEAKERAEEIEANQTLGVYDNDEDFARDEGWNDGYVSGYEDGFKDGAEFGYNKAKEELENKNAELKELLKEAVQLLKNSDELYSYQIRDFQLKCEQFTKEIKE